MGINKSNITIIHPDRKFEILDENGRICEHCNIYKPWSSFGEQKKHVTGKKDKCSICYKFVKKKNSIKSGYQIRKQKLMATDPIEHKARDIRNKLLSRSEKEDKHSVPSKLEIKDWLENQMPFTCYYSREYIDIFDCQIDHRFPVSRNGENNLGNIVLSTSRMNSAKGDMTDSEFFELLELIENWEDKGKSLISRLRRGFI